MDLFGGTGGVSKALRRLGFRSLIWDTQWGDDYDLGAPGVEKRLRKLIKSGRVKGICFATPCTSFSLARNRTNDIRNKEFPWGNPHPRHPISDHDRESLLLGNKLMLLTLRLVRICQSDGIPWCFENPATSRAFDTPEWKRIIAGPGVHEIIFDQCSCGTRWKKPTKLIFGGRIDDADLGIFENCRCNGAGACVFSGQPHIQLTGSGPGGVPWTRRAQEYPLKMCNKIAKVLSNLLRSQRI